MIYDTTTEIISKFKFNKVITIIKFNIPATDEEYSTQPALCLENLNIGVPNNWIAIN